MLRCLALALLAGCTSVGHRATESLSPAVTLASVRFASPRDVELAPRRVLSSVVELGGRMIEMSEDSLVIYPDYIIMQTRTPRSGQRILWRGGNEALPLIVVRPTSDVHVGAYRPPRSKGDVIAELLIRAVALAPFVALVYLLFTDQW